MTVRFHNSLPGGDRRRACHHCGGSQVLLFFRISEPADPCETIPIKPSNEENKPRTVFPICKCKMNTKLIKANQKIGGITL